MVDREFVMRQWDHIREYFKEGDRGGSHPRDVFENILDQYDEEIATLRASLSRAEEALAKEDGFGSMLDEIIDGLTPDERSEMKGYVHEGERMVVCDALKAKGLLFSWERATPLGGAVSTRMDWRQRHPVQARGDSLAGTLTEEAKNADS